VLLLDVSSKLLRIVTLSEGTIDRAAVYPRKLAEEVIKTGAAAVILGHNHPRAAATPSYADKILTKHLLHALDPLGVEVLDHIIIGEKDFYRFAKSGELVKTNESIKKESSTI
jgi:DNA repair protein RadC